MMNMFDLLFSDDKYSLYDIMQDFDDDNKPSPDVFLAEQIQDILDPPNPDEFDEDWVGFDENSDTDDEAAIPHPTQQRAVV